MKAARKRRPGSALLIIIVVAPASLPGDPFAYINGQRGDRLVIVETQRADGRQRIEKLRAAIHAGNAVTEVGANAGDRTPKNFRLPEVRSAVVERCGLEEALVGCAERSAGRQGAGNVANQIAREDVAVVVAGVERQTRTASEGSAQAETAVVATTLDLRNIVTILAPVERGGKGHPGTRSITNSRLVKLGFARINARIAAVSAHDFGFEVQP